MALAPGKRGAFGDWLRTQRERRYTTQKTALAAYRKLAGLTISESEYAQWESGSRTPRESNPKRAALYAFYGSREDQPAPEPLDASADLSAVLKAIADQTKAIRDLTRAIEDQGDERLVSGQATALFLGVIARSLAPQGTDFGRAIQSATDDLDALRRVTNGKE